jgi:hypothetical protein
MNEKTVVALRFHLMTPIALNLKNPQNFPSSGNMPTVAFGR